MASMLLAEVDGTMGDAKANARVRSALKKVIAKIEKNQAKDGSWNTAGGWAPILGTSYCSRSLDVAQSKGVKVSAGCINGVNTWTVNNASVAMANAGMPAKAAPTATPASVAAPADAAKEIPAIASRDATVVTAGYVFTGGSAVLSSTSTTSGNAGVNLYEYAQTVEQLSRTKADRVTNGAAIEFMTKELSKDETIRGYGSMGGEEFFSYLNTSDSLHRVGGEAWDKWNTKIKAHINALQNKDGTWCGQHCITGRVACTGAAVLTLLAERMAVPESVDVQKTESSKK